MAMKGPPDVRVNGRAGGPYTNDAIKVDHSRKKKGRSLVEVGI